MTKQKLTKEQRKNLAWEKYKEECKKIDLEEIPKIIEYNGRKYKLIEESEKQK